MRIFFAFLGLLAMTSIVFADDALVLPQGKFRARLVTSYTDADTKYGDSGELAGMGASFSRNIDGWLLTALSQKQDLPKAVKQLNSMKAGLGDSLLSEQIARIDTDVHSSIFANQFILEYGITSKLSVGIIVPMIHASVEVDAISTPSSNFVKKTSEMKDADPQKALRTGMKASTSVAAINQLLTDEFKYSGGLSSWSGTGLGDIELGFKYNYFREHPLRMTAKSGVRLPTGRVDDPDQLFDMGFGDGQFDLAIYNLIDYDLLPSVSFTWESGYTVQLPDSSTSRVPLSAELPLGGAAIRLDRKLGDYWETGIEASVKPLKRLVLSAKYRFKQKFEDSYSGAPAGVSTELLEDGTSQILHEGNFQVEYTNLSDVRAGRARVPYGLVAFYRLPFAGENINDTRTTGLQVKTYF